MTGTLRAVLSLLSMMLVASVSGWAQNITGTITGLVQDSTGAVIPGASVTAQNAGTGIGYPSTANEAGAYVLPLLPVGVYAVSIQAQGFKKFVRDGVTLGADQRVRVDVQLELGGITEQVTVTGDAPLIKTDQASIGGSFNPGQFETLPIGRDPKGLMQLVPGVINNRQGIAVGNINGSRDTATDFKVDGVGATNVNNGLLQAQPILELVEEMVVQTANYSAEFGRGATQVNLTTRSGGNQVHGALFHYFQNDHLNANSFMSNLYGNAKPVVRRNLFGGTITGPVRIPKLYDGRNRTFFAFGFEGTRNPNSSQSVSSVPTELMRAGDFTGQAPIFDPDTTRRNPAGSGYIRDPFAGNRVPSSRMDPVSLKTLQIGYPLPTRPGLANNYVFVGNGNTTDNVYNLRGDHHFNDKHRTTGRYINRTNKVLVALTFPGPAGMANRVQPRNNDFYQRIASVDHTFMIRPDLIANFHFGHSRNYTEKLGPATDQDWAGQLGIKNVSRDNFPVFQTTSLTPLGGSDYAIKMPGLNNEFSSSVISVRGRHSLKMGMEYRRLIFEGWSAGAGSGNFTFNTLPTMDPQTQRQGLGFASFLLGVPSNSSVLLLERDPYRNLWNYWATYLQDDFRVNDRLTLNLGVRWEFTTPRTEAKDRQSNFDFGTLDLRYTARDNYPRTLFNSNYRNFQPRIGFAYTPFDKRTVIRGGYGLFYMPSNSQGLGEGAFTSGPWSRSYSYISPDSGITFPFTLRQGPPKMSFSDPYVLSPATGVNWLPRNYPDEQMQQWSLNVQREIVPGMLLEGGYVGTKGNHLRMTYSLNQVPVEKLGPGDAQSRRPYPTRGNITAQFSPTGSSTYHAFQARAERRLSSGLTFQAVYTWSKAIDNASGIDSSRSFGVVGPQDNFDLRSEKSVAAFDTPQNFAFSGAWQLPAGKGRRWLDRGGFTDVLLGGWNLSLLSNMLSGMPLMMSTITNLTGSLNGGSRPNRTNDVPLSGNARGIDQWFNANGFSTLAPFTFGNTSRTEPRLREPGDINMSLMLAKDFHLSERFRLQFRSEFFNALNHFNPGAPNTTIGHAAVGTITSGNGGRSIQLSMKLYY